MTSGSTTSFGTSEADDDTNLADEPAAPPTQYQHVEPVAAAPPLPSCLWIIDILLTLSEPELICSSVLVNLTCVSVP